ncbi:MAG TPA: OsmC family protein [Mycobacteriales bacterium]|nr:OsmC family protein [Mycobacteriales bacterium]
MPTTRVANATWEGGLADGKGQVELSSSGVGTFDVSWPARSEEPNGLTSPEELIAAAHASCFSMALSNVLGKQGNAPQRLDTRAEVDFQPGKGITQIRLSVRGSVPGLDADAFRTAAEDAKVNCPVSQALKAVEITLDAALA